MDVDPASPLDRTVAGIAAAIGEPARARMLSCLMDGHARTSTELSIVAEVGASTASAHLGRLLAERLIGVAVQGKHRYYRLAGPEVARALESLNVLAGGAPPKFNPTTPVRLRHARTCYDHLAGTVAVRLHDRFLEQGWLVAADAAETQTYEVSAAGRRAFGGLGIDVDTAQALRRRFAFGCLDWSERRPHLGGALAAAFLAQALKRRWFLQDLDTRILAVTRAGRRELSARFRLEVPEEPPVSA